MLLATPEISDILDMPPGNQTNVAIRPVEDMLTRALLYNSAWNRKFLVSAIVFSSSQPKTYVTALRESFYTVSIERARSIFKLHDSQEDSGILVSGGEHSEYIYWVQNHNDIRTMNPIGKMILEIDPRRLFSDHLQSLKGLYPNAQTFVFNEDRSIFFGASGQNKLFQNTRFPETPDQIRISGEPYYCIVRPLQAFSLKAAVLIPQAELYGSLT